MNCQTGKYIQHQNKNKPYHVKERLISYQFHVQDLFMYVRFDHTFPCCIVVKDVKFFNQCRELSASNFVVTYFKKQAGIK